jgi:hypothetical protein
MRNNIRYLFTKKQDILKIYFNNNNNNNEKINNNSEIQ